MAAAQAVCSAETVVARVAYHSSDVVVSVQPSLSQSSHYGDALKQLASRGVESIVSASAPEVIPVRHNADPFLSAIEPARSGKLVSIATVSNTLLSSIPQIYKLANHPVVIHVSLQPSKFPDYSEITAIRQTGLILLQSETVREAQHIAAAAHALAIRSGKAVLHFFTAPKEEEVSLDEAALLEKLIDVGTARSYRFKPSNAKELYAGDGRIPQTTRLVDAEPNGVNAGAAPARTNGSIATPNGYANGNETESSVVSPSGGSDRSTQRDLASSISSIDSATITRPVTSDDIVTHVNTIFEIIREVTGSSYKLFEYSGPANATHLVVVFGSSAQTFRTELATNKTNGTFTGVGVLTIRLYRPWFGARLSEYFPKTVTKVAVLEQIKRKTTKWGPLFLDLVTVLRSEPSARGPRTVVGFQLAYVSEANVERALTTVVQTINHQTPTQNVVIGAEDAPEESAGDYELSQPQIETAYLKVLNQLFTQRLHIANALGSDNAGISSTTTASPEFGFGSLIARQEAREKLIKHAETLAKENKLAKATAEAVLKWLLVAEDAVKSSEVASELTAALEKDGSAGARELLASKHLFNKESQWLVGSDAWSYDLGNSGVHHVIASGKNINMLIIDSQPYSEKASADATRRKKDVGLYAMNFGNAYVASTAVYSSYTQLLHALIEADKFDGPSVVLAYLPYNKEDDSPLTVLQETKKAVDIGYWPLYRWNPLAEETGGVNFQLDSERIKKDLQAFLDRENHLTHLIRRHPQFAANLSSSYGSEVRAQQKRTAKDAYTKLLEGLTGPPLTILFASDGGNAEGLAKRLERRAKARGLKGLAIAMDDYPVEDLAGEENVVFITSTAGQGEFPQNGRNFWETVKNSTDIDLASVNYSVFTLGDSHYWPRKEDKVYYNKPGKDLDKRLEDIGGKRIVDIGLGDDQDPDGYQTGYSEWEPKLWAALGVDKVEGLADEPPPITNEDIKIASNFLRGTIEQGLADESTGAISAEDQQLTKFHGTYMQDDRDLREERKAQGLEPAYSFMIRCRLPGGISTPLQWVQMDQISSDYGNETLKLTTRQTFQFHGVLKRNLKASMRAINRSLMTTIAACGDVNRNVMCSSLPQLSGFHRQTWEKSKLISDHLLPAAASYSYYEIWIKDENDDKTQVGGNVIVDQEPLYGPTYLPRKFKITIAIPPHNDTDVYAHDIGLIAIKGADGNLAGFNVLIGGGMGVTHNNKKTYPRTGSLIGYADKEDIHIVCEKIMLVQRDHGDRKNRKHARLKYTVDDMGVEVYKAKVEELWGKKFEEAKPFHFDSNVDTFGWQTDETGKHHFTLFIENGRIEDTAEFKMRTGLREIAKVLRGEFRLTGNQHLIISNVEDDQLQQIKDMLAQYKLDNLQFSGLRLSSSACVAFPTCGLAMAESERYLPVLITKVENILEENGLRNDSIVMRMTGCPNGCARPWLAEVGFVGKAFGAYNMYLGGGYHGQRLSKLYRSSIKEEEILEILKVLFKRYSLEREEGERFGDFCIRAGIIKETTEGKNFHDDVAEAESDEE